MSAQPSFAFTVFTPTYDRAATLPAVKASLEAQTFTDFEWLIVDDGSTDGTEAMVTEWLQSSPLTIRYLRQENAGKHVAFNRGVREAQGDLFLALDSDDECVPEALERFLSHWQGIPAEVRGSFSAVTGLCVDDHGAVVGERFPSDPYDSDPLSIYFEGVGRGEKWGFHRTDVLRQFPFPEPPGATFVSEAVVWFAIGRHYRTRYVNDPLRIYRASTGARLSHLTRRTAFGRLVFHREVLDQYVDFLPRAPMTILKSAINYCRYSFHCGIWPVGQVRRVATRQGRILALASLMPGAIAYARDVMRSRSRG